MNTVSWKVFLISCSLNRGSVVSRLITTAVFRQSDSHYTGCGDEIVHHGALNERGSIALTLKAHCEKCLTPLVKSSQHPHLSVNQPEWWSIYPGTVSLWGASVNRCTTMPHICENNISNYSQLLEIFKGGEQLGKWDIRSIPGNMIRPTALNSKALLKPRCCFTCCCIFSCIHLCNTLTLCNSWPNSHSSGWMWTSQNNL